MFHNIITGSQTRDQLQEVPDNLMKNLFQVKLFAPFNDSGGSDSYDSWLDSAYDIKPCAFYRGVVKCVCEQVCDLQGLNQLQCSFTVCCAGADSCAGDEHKQTKPTWAPLFDRWFICLSSPTPPHPVLKCSACNIQSHLCVFKTKLPRFLSTNLDR